VTDARTGEPVKGATVFVGFKLETLLGLTRSYDERWIDTDADGRFSIEGHFRDSAPSWSVSPSCKPFVRIIHPELGHFQFVFEEHPFLEPIEFPGYRNMSFSIEPSEASLEYLQSPAYRLRMCGNYSREACVRVCEVAYGSADACDESALDRWILR
jgi:hypothetical protein